ncbi:putative ankyrin repeat protein [Porphyridium purpureum]|uniref:Putative ankyrin repeat protein n=1 Tax=Porphyridium purpureum TaxID=35688 RepID=A0A5J4YIL0_PORPP|nr:putative ankyrin repeat protein [Porphyridium purpureum]|eukprot:POR9902..scf261_15
MYGEAGKELRDAVVARDVAAVEALVRAGSVDVDALVDGCVRASALTIAASRGFADVVDVLVRLGADVNARGAAQMTALMYAASRGFVDIAVALVDAGAELDACAIGHSNALMVAAAKGRIDVANALLERGANVNMWNAAGMTASDIAHDAGFLELAGVLTRVTERQRKHTQHVSSISTEPQEQQPARRDESEDLEPRVKRVKREHVALSLQSEPAAVALSTAPVTPERDGRSEQPPLPFELTSSPQRPQTVQAAPSIPSTSAGSPVHQMQVVCPTLPAQDDSSVQPPCTSQENVHSRNDKPSVESLEAQGSSSMSQPATETVVTDEPDAALKKRSCSEFDISIESSGVPKVMRREATSEPLTYSDAYDGNLRVRAGVEAPERSNGSGVAERSNGSGVAERSNGSGMAERSNGSSAAKRSNGGGVAERTSGETDDSPPKVTKWKCVKDVKTLRRSNADIEIFYSDLENWANVAFSDDDRIHEDIEQLKKIVRYGPAYIWCAQVIVHPLQVKIATKTVSVQNRRRPLNLPKIVAALGDYSLLSTMLKKLYFADDRNKGKPHPMKGKLKFQSAHFAHLALNFIHGLGISAVQLRRAQSPLII